MAGDGGQVEDEADSHHGDDAPVTALFANLKGFGRALEKAVLRPKSGVPWDLIRGQLICTSCDHIKKCLELLTLEASPTKGLNEIVIVTANNRFQNPAAGWRDVSLYFF